MAYFDNAATTYPKPECVYSQMDTFYRQHGGSFGRGVYKDTLSSGALVKETRQSIKQLLHCPSKEVVFTPSATIALNMIIQGVIETGRVRNVYITPFEHNSVTRVLHHYELKHQVRIETISVSPDYHYQTELIKHQFEAMPPDLVILSHASNVIGLVCPILEIFSLAKKYNSINVVDMAQTAGLIDVNIGSQTVDFAVFAGHKTLYAPTGISGFVMNSAVELEPILFGGTGFDSANQDMPRQIPERYEMGTVNISGIAGLHAALEWIDKTGIALIRKREEEHRQRLIDLFKDYQFLKIIGCHENEECVGIVSLIVPGISSESAGQIFSERNIAIRTGLQCAPIAHRFLGSYPAGTLRFSTGYFTSDADFDELRHALDNIQEVI